MNESSPFAVRTVVILVIGGALLLLGAILLSGFGGDVARIVGDAPAADRKDGAGYHAFRRLVDTVQPAPAASGDPAGAAPILILTPSETTRPQDVKAIVDRRIEMAAAAAEYDDSEDTEGPPPRYATLIILPKWQVAKLPLQGARVQRTGSADPFKVMQFVPTNADWHGEQIQDTGPMAGTVFFGLRPFAVIGPVQALKGDAITPLIGARDGAAVLGQIDGSDTFVLADADLINNRAMVDERNALAALAMLRAIDPEHGGAATFDRSLHFGAGDRNLVKLLFLPPFLGVTLALIAAAILAGIAAANRFGPIVREHRALAAGKRALIDNIVSLTRLAGRTRNAGARYADTMLETIGRRVGLGAGTAIDRLDAIHPGYSDIDRSLRDARTEGEALAAATRLHAWKKETGG